MHTDVGPCEGPESLYVCTHVCMNACVCHRGVWCMSRYECMYACVYHRMQSSFQRAHMYAYMYIYPCMHHKARLRPNGFACVPIISEIVLKFFYYWSKRKRSSAQLVTVTDSGCVMQAIRSKQLRKIYLAAYTSDLYYWSK